LDHAQVPTVDFYSYTAVGKRWISTEWLAEIFFALVFKIGEWRGVVLLSALACATMIAIVCFYLLQHLRFSIAVGWTALTALAISSHFLARPHLFSYIVALIWVIKLLESYDRSEFRSATPVFCVLMVLWANLHPSFTFGVVLLYVFAGCSCYEKLSRGECRECKEELLAVIGVSLCALLTPYGIFSALLTLQTISMKIPLQHVIEWHSPDLQQDKIHLFLIVSFLMVMTGLGVRLQGPRLIVYGMTLILGLSYSRGLSLFFLLSPILFARPIADSAIWCRAVQNSQAANGSKVVKSLDPILLYIQKRSLRIPAFGLAVAALVTAMSWRELGVGPPNSVAPKAAMDFVIKAGITGNVFNNYNFGGYLIFKGIPTFIDGREPPYTDEFLRQYFDTIQLADGTGALQLLDRYNVKWALLQPTDPLTKALTKSDQWKDVYADNYSTVIVRSREPVGN
jgi:hypothetical protein